jgi:hypothetical protein
MIGGRGSVVVETLCSKLERCEIEYRRDHLIFFNLPIPSSHTIAPGLTQPLTEKSIRNLTVK